MSDFFTTPGKTYYQHISRVLFLGSFLSKTKLIEPRAHYRTAQWRWANTAESWLLIAPVTIFLFHCSVTGFSVQRAARNYLPVKRMQICSLRVLTLWTYTCKWKMESIVLLGVSLWTDSVLFCFFFFFLIKTFQDSPWLKLFFFLSFRGSGKSLQKS